MDTAGDDDTLRAVKQPFNALKQMNSGFLQVCKLVGDGVRKLGITKSSACRAATGARPCSAMSRQMAVGLRPPDDGDKDARKMGVCLVQGDSPGSGLLFPVADELLFLQPVPRAPCRPAFSSAVCSCQ